MKRMMIAGLLLALCAVSPGADAERPNVVVFLVDDMGVMDTSVPFLTDAGGVPQRYPLNEFYHTPNMERLAAVGIRFNNFQAMSVCSPTRVSIMTGQNAARHRTTNWIDPFSNNRNTFGPSAWNWRGLKKSDVTLPRLLQANGYRTLHVGKAHFGPRGSEGKDPMSLGFDVNVAGCEIGHPGSYYGERQYGHVGAPANGVPGLEKYHGTETFLTEALTREAKSLVSESVKDGKPFYLYLSHYAVHAPFDSDPRYAERYKGSGKPAMAQAFATLIEGMDKSLGDILDHLRELGVADRTLVLFLGDNGSDAPLGGPHVAACAAPLRGKKGSHYEGGMRVPFIAAWAEPDPGNPWQQRLPIPAGAVQGQLASVCDIFPTLLGLLEIAVPGDHVVDGHRLDTLLAGKGDQARPDEFLMHYPHESRSNYFTAFRSRGWKVVYHYFPGEASNRSRYQLFNLAEDPFEQSDLAAAQPDRLRSMMQELCDRLERHDALYPVDRNGQPQKPVIPSAANPSGN